MAETTRKADAAPFDPVQFEVIRNSLNAVCAEMAVVLSKSAYSIAVNEARDFAGTVYDRDGNLAARSEFDLPAFVGVSMSTVPEVLRQVGDEGMEPGDIFMINDPYVASTHCNDIHFIKPIFYQGKRVAFVANTAHWTDVGGAVPGSLNSEARTFYEEGMRIPPVKVFQRDELQDDLVRLLMANMRESWERMGDLRAQCAALQTGDARIQVLIERHGLDAVMASMEETQGYAARMLRAALRKLPDGVYVGEDRIDKDLATGDPVTIRVKAIIEGEHITFDLTENDDAKEYSINATRPATLSGVLCGLGAILPPMPMNGGILRAMEFKARPGSLVYAQPPVAISTQASSSVECIIGATMLALSQALPERGAGVYSTILNTTYNGFDSRDGFESPYTFYVWAYGGMGGTLTKDGANTVGTAYAATIQNVPVELQERRYPVLWRRYQLLTDSGGPGRSRGGLALDQVFELPFHSGRMSDFGNRERFGSPGIFGGEPGGLAGLVVQEGTEEQQRLGLNVVNVFLDVGTILHFWSSGGGGYGDSLERSVQRVLEDVMDDYVTIAEARARYGVVVNEIDRRTLQYEIDEGATARLRAEMQRARGQN